MQFICNFLQFQRHFEHYLLRSLCSLGRVLRTLTPCGARHRTRAAHIIFICVVNQLIIKKMQKKSLSLLHI